MKKFGLGAPTVLCGLALLLTLSTTAASSDAAPPVELDARIVPWATLRRFALEAGFFPPVYRPRSEAEVVALLSTARASGDSTLLGTRVGESGRLQWWLDYYREGGGGWIWQRDVGQGQRLRARVSGRMLTGYTELGSPFELESGLSWSPGWNATFEPVLDLSLGRWWISATARFGGRVAPGGVEFPGPRGRLSPLTWPGWSTPTARGQVRNARLQGDAWSFEVPRLVAGVGLGDWSLSAGWMPRRTGTAVTGALTFDYSAVTFPSVSFRRTSPFHAESRFLNLLAPEDLMLNTGWMSERMIRFRDADDLPRTRSAAPVFFQWLVGWELTSWFRATLIHAAMAAPREGSLWPDVFQVAFPTPGITESEMRSGPVTDRVFAVQYEVRWRDAPWRGLPSSAGRIYLDWGAEDYNGRGPNGLIPQIAAPAHIGGVELVSPAWDLVLEYSELVHNRVLWYSNSGFPDGYSQDGWVLGNALGGSAEAFTGIVRVRPEAQNFEIELRTRRANWGMERKTPGTGEAKVVSLSLRSLPSSRSQSKGSRVWASAVPRWELSVEWNRETADPEAWSDSDIMDSSTSRDWWRVLLRADL